MTTYTHARYDDLSDMPTHRGGSRTWHLGGAWTLDEANLPMNTVKARVFGQLVRLYTHVLAHEVTGVESAHGQHYPSDLFRDACIMENEWRMHQMQDFIFECDAWGTWLWTRDSSGAFPDGNRKVRHLCTVWGVPLEHSDSMNWYMAARVERWVLPTPTVDPWWKGQS